MWIKQHRVIYTSFRLHGEFQAEEYSKVFLWNPWNVLTKMRRKKKGQILYIASGNDQIANSAKLFDITHESYTFGAELIETIN